jgi:hypothetical protein
MTKHTAPAADEGLPKLNSGGSILMETEQGLSVCRSIKSLRGSILPAESLDEFMSLLDRYVEAGDREDFIRSYWQKMGYAETCRDVVRKAAFDQKSARRDLIRHIKKVRAAPSKNLDDILFKAEICAVLEPYDVGDRRSVAHSIVNDLLSAGCVWTAKTEREAS